MCHHTLFAEQWPACGAQSRDRSPLCPCPPWAEKNTEMPDQGRAWEARVPPGAARGGVRRGGVSGHHLCTRCPSQSSQQLREWDSG